MEGQQEAYEPMMMMSKGKVYTSPASKFKASLQETISSSKVYRDISPLKLYAALHTDENRATLPDLFKQKDALFTLRPTFLADLQAKEAEDLQKPPKLLTKLEALLEEKMSVIQKLGSAKKGFAATQMRTDACRQVFEAFLHSFTTYRPLLQRIKNEYDMALDDALASVYDNVHMREDLAAAKQVQETDVLEARQKALTEAVDVRRELEHHIAVEEQLIMEAERRSQAAEAEVAKVRGHITSMKRDVEQLRQHNRHLKRQLLEDSTWTTPALLQRYEDPIVRPSLTL